MAGKSTERVVARPGIDGADAAMERSDGDDAAFALYVETDVKKAEYEITELRW